MKSLLFYVLPFILASSAFGQISDTPKPVDNKAVSAQNPLLKMAWKTPFDAPIYRLAIADTAGDGKPRLIALLQEGNNALRLSVYRWDGKTFISEWSTPVEKSVTAMAVGRFAPGVPSAQIVTAQGCYLWDGKEFTLKPFSRPLAPVGIVRHREGEESLLAREGGEYAVYAIDPKGVGDDWLVPGKPLTPLGAAGEMDYLFGLLRAAPTELEAGTPPEYAAVGLLGLWDVRRDGKPLRFLGRYSSRSNDAGSHLVFAQEFSSNAIKEVWRSPGLDGPILDVALGDPKGEGKEGLLVLAVDPKSKGRVLYLFVADKT